MQIVSEHSTNSEGVAYVRPLRVELYPETKGGTTCPKLAIVLCQAGLLEPIEASNACKYYFRSNDKGVMIDFTQSGHRTVSEALAKEIGEKAQAVLTENLTTAYGFIQFTDTLFKADMLEPISQRFKKLEDLHDRQGDRLKDEIKSLSHDTEKRLDFQRSEIAKIWGILQPEEGEPVKAPAIQRVRARARASWQNLAKRIRSLTRRPAMRVRVEAYDD